MYIIRKSDGVKLFLFLFISLTMVKVFAAMNLSVAKLWYIDARYNRCIVKIINRQTHVIYTNDGDCNNDQERTQLWLRTLAECQNDSNNVEQNGEYYNFEAYCNNIEMSRTGNDPNAVDPISGWHQVHYCQSQYYASACAISRTNDQAYCSTYCSNTEQNAQDQALARCNLNWSWLGKKEKCFLQKTNNLENFYNLKPRFELPLLTVQPQYR